LIISEIMFIFSATASTQKVIDC